MMKQTILKWLNNLEGQSKKLKKKLQDQKQKKFSEQPSLLTHRVAKIDDGILGATIDTKGRDVVITIKGFNSVAKAIDWATLQSILWKTDQEARLQLQRDLTPKDTYH